MFEILEHLPYLSIYFCHCCMQKTNGQADFCSLISPFVIPALESIKAKLTVCKNSVF